ncbi:hypothetical protein EYF80_047248 [Liparis tanakae]|uniref:Uncharacterized protein n=1 Tax=Liparis tanakae TaxID=230148 RepID=A0A4Z2FNY4_9TELE|nr:hypothetical protein EYF80_047248 [Liparis tanakae]
MGRETFGNIPFRSIKECAHNHSFRVSWMWSHLESFWQAVFKPRNEGTSGFLPAADVRAVVIVVSFPPVGNSVGNRNTSLHHTPEAASGEQLTGALRNAALTEEVTTRSMRNFRGLPHYEPLAV